MDLTKDGPAQDGRAGDRRVEPHPPHHRVLRRTRRGKVVAGVAAGLARYVDLDPVVVRLAFVLLAVFGGSGVLLYLVGWLLVPWEEEGDPVDAGPPPVRVPGTVLVGAVLVLLGVAGLGSRVLPGAGPLVGPLVLLTVGLLVVAASWRGER